MAAVEAALSKYVNPALEIATHYIEINNIDYLKGKLNYVMVNFVSAWQSTCLALWWLLTPRFFTQQW